MRELLGARPPPRAPHRVENGPQSFQASLKPDPTSDQPRARVRTPSSRNSGAFNLSRCTLRDIRLTSAVAVIGAPSEHDGRSCTFEGPSRRHVARLTEAPADGRPRTTRTQELPGIPSSPPRGAAAIMQTDSPGGGRIAWLCPAWVNRRRSHRLEVWAVCSTHGWGDASGSGAARRGEPAGIREAAIAAPVGARSIGTGMTVLAPSRVSRAHGRLQPQRVRP
jgi:hypothetical protein